MRRRGNRTNPKGEFGRELTKVLIARDMNNVQLWANLVSKGTDITKQFLDMTISGSRHPPVHLIEAICACLELLDERRQRLHRAAALDRGYRIGEI